ncbi:RNA polymerase sigma factor [Dyella psychrodurans]|uniref:Sigma-70 family RNA polymerase sigma factor n=1 Tax=Dyella psychrodurans TaxID=1927960 RepID=A0A370XAN1_9GAMM|nr:sigma-70 family RNA polymerase sigma factor [Dyella psychrodurans]RDS85484.1 sigma-70 family RNA polymerase sigma factor [Dyella psychrodurans]
MNNVTDRTIVEAALANAPGAFERLVREHQELCWHIIYRMVRHPEDARELCQDTFLRVHQNLRQYRYESTLKSWIGRIAYNVALRYLERKRIALLAPSGDDDSAVAIENIGDGFDLETAYADSDMAWRLRAAIEALPPLQRTVLTLYHLDELPIGEIADITGLASGTIKSHLFRSRLRLRELLEAVNGVLS